MHFDRKWMKVLAVVLLGLNACFVLAFVLARPPLRSDSWSFLDRQRPSQMNMIADGLDFALARRPIGGWEPISVRLFLLVNVPAYFASFFTFQLLQESAAGSSRSNSDLATLVFVVLSVAQWLAVSALLSMRR